MRSRIQGLDGGSVSQHSIVRLKCEFGLISAHLAELMRKDGFDAASLRGGVRVLRRRAES